MEDGLNEQQRQVVQSGDGPLLIVAGPGTGKTKTLTARIAHLITSGRVQPNQILALTFTAKAARGMSQRVAALVGGAQPDISTFHALSYRMLRERLGELRLVSEVDRTHIIRELTKPKGF